MAFRCFALDLITDFVFGFNFDSLNSPGFQCPIIKGQDSLLAGLWLQGQSSWLRDLTNFLSPWSLQIFYPKSALLFDKMAYLQARLDDVLCQKADDHGDHACIPLFEALTMLVESSGVPLRSYTSIVSESFNMIFGPGYILSTTLTMATYFIARDRETLSNLRKELEVAWPKSQKRCPSWTALEQLPFLTAVINETILMTGAVSTGAPRVTPLGGMEIAGDHFPQGITVSSSSYFPCHDETIFKDPMVFRPERWVTGGKELQKWNLAFSVGPRQCPATSFSEAALYLCLAHIVHFFELDYPDRGRIKYKDYFVPLVDGCPLLATVKKRH